MVWGSEEAASRTRIKQIIPEFNQNKIKGREAPKISWLFKGRYKKVAISLHLMNNCIIWVKEIHFLAIPNNTFPYLLQENLYDFSVPRSVRFTLIVPIIVQKTEKFQLCRNDIKIAQETQ